MPLVNITRKPTTLQAYQLSSVSDMLAALDYLKSRGYSGTINLYKVNGTPTWQMTLQPDSGSAAQMAIVGDWVVIENDAIANIVVAAKAATLYQLA